MDTYTEEDNRQYTDYSDKRILVVDDNKLNLKVALKFMSKYNFKTDECYSGEECLDKIRRGEKYDIIFMDIMMPTLNGVETFHELQRIKGFNTPVVIALTADAVEGAKEKYLREGFAEYISKPIVRDHLDEVVHKVLDK
ncbi:MAG: response regulator [Bacilli bacterium]|nr:response regulator [Bacilli bacterium]